MRPLILAEARVEGLDSLIKSRQTAASRATMLGLLAIGASAVHAVSRRTSPRALAGAASAVAVSIAALGAASKRRDLVIQDELREMIYAHDFGESSEQRALRSLALRDIRGLMERGITAPTPSGRTVHLAANDLVYAIDRRSAK